MRFINPSGWPRPAGYTNGVVARGTYLAVAGQIGWNERGEFVSDDFCEQARQALENVIAIVKAAGGDASCVARLTWYVVDKQEYLRSSKRLGSIYAAAFGRHYPAMTLVQVAALLEDRAKVEIEATAILPP